MILRLKRRRAILRRQLSQHRLEKNILNAIRKRKGHRPLSADREGGDFVISSYNIHKCVGVDKVFNPSRIIEVISELDTDILALQEADKRFGDRISLIDLEELERETGLKPVPINTMSPNGVGWHGNALFIRSGQVRDVLQIDLPGIEPRGALIAELEMSAGPIRVVAAHFGLLRNSRSKQARAILSILQERKTMPTIMIGDLNEWRVGKGSALTNLNPYFDVTMGTVPSFPSRFPIFALDRMFAYPHDLIIAIESHKSLLSQIASDHLPITAHIDLASAVLFLQSKDKVSRAI